jgi:hypothetical protein
MCKHRLDIVRCRTMVTMEFDIRDELRDVCAASCLKCWLSVWGRVSHTPLLVPQPLVCSTDLCHAPLWGSQWC